MQYAPVSRQLYCILQKFYFNQEANLVFALYPDYLEKCGILLPAGALDPVSQFSQFGNQQVPVLPLDFNRPVFNSAARAAALLEFQGESFQFIAR